MAYRRLISCTTLAFFLYLRYPTPAKCASRGFVVELPQDQLLADYSLLMTIRTNMTGKIKRLTDKGFGFITPDGSDKDVFFHNSALVGVSFDELRDGDAVTFEVEDSDKGPRAKDVKRA